MLIQLLLSQYLKESFHSTAYSINVYVIPGQQAIRLVRYSREDIEGGKGPRIQIVFLKKASKKVSRKRPASPGNQSTLDGATQKLTGVKKLKRVAAEEVEEDLPFYVDDDSQDVADMSDIEEEAPLTVQRQSNRRKAEKIILSDSEDGDWSFNMSGASNSKKYGLTSKTSIGTKRSRERRENGVIVLSD